MRELFRWPRFPIKPLAAAAAVLAYLNSGTMVFADYNDAKRQFDRLDIDTRIEMTLGLIATGDFDGLLDFGFTKRYFNAVTSFERREGLAIDGILDPNELERLNARANEFYGPLGLRYYHHPSTRSKLFVPRRLFESETRTPHGMSFERADKELSLSFVYYPEDEKNFAALYSSMATPSNRRSIAYQRLRDAYFVANGTYRGRNFYTWMSRIEGGSTGFTISWADRIQGTGMRLSILLANSFLPVSTSDDTPSPPEPESGGEFASIPRESEPVPSGGTGTGFRITPEGHVLTNFHVAGKCASLKLRKVGHMPVSAELVAGDETNDLALVKARDTLSGVVATFSGVFPKAGSDIAVFGFPLTSILSDSGNIVTGNITSLAGLGNDSRLFQISAPVQPGNSGGPVVDRSGNVVAVVVSKLDAKLTAERTGDIPQNINFAIKANVAMNFLDGIGINYQRGGPSPTLDTPAIADLARDFTFLVECRN